MTCSSCLRPLSNLVVVSFSKCIVTGQTIRSLTHSPSWNVLAIGLTFLSYLLLQSYDVLSTASSSRRLL